MARPRCDTPGCGRLIPIGGEGHPEICPKCLDDIAAKEKAKPKRSVYHREVPTTCPKCSHKFGATIDVYAVLHAFGVKAQTIGHAIKKLLLPGQRSGGKSEDQDVGEAIWTLQRHQQMRAEETT